MNKKGKNNISYDPRCPMPAPKTVLIDDKKIYSIHHSLFYIVLRSFFKSKYQKLNKYFYNI